MGKCDIEGFFGNYASCDLDSVLVDLSVSMMMH